MNKSDKLVITAFKAAAESAHTPGLRVETAKLLDRAVADLRTAPARDAAMSLTAFLSQGRGKRDAPVPVEAIKSLVAARLSTSAEYVFLWCLPMLAVDDIEEVLALIATTKGLQAWLNIRFPNDRPGQAAGVEWLIEQALSDPSRAVGTVLAKGFVDLTPLSQLPGASIFFTVPHRARWLMDTGSLLLDALKRDKGGRFLEKLLRELPHHEDSWNDTLALIKADAVIFDKMIDELPAIVARDTGGALQTFVAALFADLPRITGPKRRVLCARMLKLGAGLFAGKSGFGVERALQALHSVSQRLVEAIPAGESDADVCGIIYARSDTPGQNERITFDGARHMVLAMEKIREGTDPLLMLEATAANLGLVPIGVLGERFPYDPMRHREIAGDAQTGDAVVFLEKGWLLEGQVIERAKVKKS